MKKKWLTIYFLFLITIVSAIGFFIFHRNAVADDVVTMTVKISVCGNEEKEYGEDCDNDDLGGGSCVSQGFISGVLSCDIACEYDTSACVLGPTCGDGTCNGTETCGSCPADCGNCGGGGGGGGGYVPPATSVIFSGRAYPKSAITLLKDAQIAATTVAGADANFSINLAGLSGGNYIFSVYAEDNKGNRSSLLSFPVSVTVGATTNVGGIFIAPTIAVDKSEVKRGDNIVIFGQSAQSSEITIMINSDEEYFVKTSTDKNGIYLHNFDTAPLEIGQHLAKSKAALGGEISSFSKVVDFTVGTKNVSEKAKCGKADLNCDTRVNLVDFSIAAYWYKRPISANFAIIEKERLNGDGKIDLVDFSIMAYYWTG